MKKLVLTVAIVLGMTVGATAQQFSNNGQTNGGGLFGRGETPDYGNDRTNTNLPLLPNHGASGNQDASVPLGSGALLLVGFGAAYAMAKKNRKE